MSADGERRWLEARAWAKLNLRLVIFPPTADGYHPIETIFCRVDLADTVQLALREGPGVELRVDDGFELPTGRENLAVRAADLFIREIGLERGVEIELRKAIPPGGGLGGGSADAAAVLALLARATGFTDRQRLLALAGELGSDVPFLVADLPLALAWGRGDRLLALPRLAVRPMLLLISPAAVSTRAAYEHWDRMAASSGRRRPLNLDLAQLQSWEDIAGLAVNDFESVVFEMRPDLAAGKERLLGTGAEIALLTGSGSTLFGVYRSQRERDAAAESLRGNIGQTRVVSVVGPV